MELLAEKMRVEHESALSDLEQRLKQQFQS